MSFLEIVFVVLMMIWLFGGFWIYWEPGRPQIVGGHFLQWCCTAILGYVIFGGR